MSDTKTTPASLEAMQGAQDELMKVINYLASARNYYASESEDETRGLDDRLHSGTKALAIAELAVALIKLKHR